MTLLEEKLAPYDGLGGYALERTDARRIGAEIDEVISAKDDEIARHDSRWGRIVEILMHEFGGPTRSEDAYEAAERILFAQRDELARLREIVAAADRLRSSASIMTEWNTTTADCDDLKKEIAAYDAIRQAKTPSMPNTGESSANTWEIATLRSEIAHLRGMIEGGAEAQRWINRAHESRIEALELRGWADQEQDDDSRG